MPEPVILIRASLAEEEEREVAKKHFHVVENRTEIEKGELVIPRYSLLPYPRELEADVTNLRASLINTTAQHLYVADINNWYPDFELFTPKTYLRLSDMPGVSAANEDAYVLKGVTNSRKHNWRTHMFAPNRVAVPAILNRLLDDPLIADQGIVARVYERFQQLDEGINGMPVTNEWRFFILDGEVLAGGFYWSDHPELHEAVKTYYLGALAFVRDFIAPKLKDKIRFVVADVAAHATRGVWRLVELNDGCMSGLGCVAPDALYYALAKCLG